MGSRGHQRPVPNPWNIGFGAVMLTAALLTLFLWIPNDIVGGFIVAGPTGRPEPGDAFFPILLTSTLLILSVVQLLGEVFKRPRAEAEPDIGTLTPDNLRFLLIFYAIALAGLAIMYWLGPLSTDLLRAAGIIDATYRQLVDTVPYKYIGYLSGGFLMTFGLIVWAEGKLRWLSLFTVIITLAVSVLIFDILLTNVPLPPNADF